MSVTLEIDFTGQSPAGGGLGYLTTGLHKAMILEFKHFADSNRLYCYMMTEGVRHRDSFSLSEKALPFLMGFLISAGVPEKKLNGKITIQVSAVRLRTAANIEPLLNKNDQIVGVNKSTLVQIARICLSCVETPFGAGETIRINPPVIRKIIQKISAKLGIGNIV